MSYHNSLILVQIQAFTRELSTVKNSRRKHGPATKCKINQAVRERGSADPSVSSNLEILRAFTSKHRPTLAEYGICALDLANYHTRCLHDVLYLVFIHRGEATCMRCRLSSSVLRSVHWSLLVTKQRKFEGSFC